MIRTKTIYSPKEATDGLRALITRFYPRGIRKTHFDVWMKDLAPSKDLINEYKSNKITWDQLVIDFKLELQENKDAISIMNDLKNKIKSENVTLLCFEKNGVPCHRHILKQIIENPRKLKNSFKPNFQD